MYTNSFVRCSRFGPNLNAVVRGFSVDSGRKWLLHPSVKYLCLIGGSLVALGYARHHHQPRVHALQLRKVGADDDDGKRFHFDELELG